MKWIKASERLPEILKDVFIKEGSMYHTGYYNDVNKAFKSHVWNDFIDSDFSNIEWLDESINQEGSLKDSDWKEKFKEWLSDNTQRISNHDLSNAYKGGAIEAGNYLGKNVIAPLLQKEYKGDGLVSSDIKIASPVSTRPSSFTNSIEQENLLIIQTKTNNMNNIELVDFFAASALQGLISKLPLLDRDGQFADKLSSDEIQAIKKELCESAYNYACHMLNAKTEFKDFIKKHEYGNQSAQ